VVNSVSDAVNGDCSSVSALWASPGPDGISLREAITASNNRLGEEVIRFDPLLAGAIITVGVTTHQALPMFLGGGLTIDGDIDGDGHPDVTLDGSPGAVFGGPLVNGLSIWSSGNTVQHLRFTEFGRTIQFAVPEPPKGHRKAIWSNRVLDNIIEASHSVETISVGPLGLVAWDTPEAILNLTWEDIVIAGNVITSPVGIRLYASSGFATHNRITSVTIRGNRLSGGAGINLGAADANTAYHHLPPPIQYADYNAITDVWIEGDLLDGSGIGVGAANTGNRYNRVERVSILGNTVRKGGIAIGVSDGGDRRAARPAPTGSPRWRCGET
jgi:hypothetical protein